MTMNSPEDSVVNDWTRRAARVEPLPEGASGPGNRTLLSTRTPNMAVGPTKTGRATHDREESGFVPRRAPTRVSSPRMDVVNGIPPVPSGRAGRHPSWTSSVGRNFIAHVHTKSVGLQ